MLDQGASRVAILDVDYHHGNGTQDIFYDRGDVLFTSIHGDPRFEYPYFLGFADEKGVGVGEGFNFNYPLAAGSDWSVWSLALAAACRQIAAYGADALVVSLGVDTFKEDPISQFKLDSPDYTAWVKSSPGLACRPCSSWKAVTRWKRSASMPSTCCRASTAPSAERAATKRPGNCRAFSLERSRLYSTRVLKRLSPPARCPVARRWRAGRRRPGCRWTPRRPAAG